MTQRLTIVLPLKGRPLFTLRFLWHADRASLPYRFLVADGQVRPELASILENSRQYFPNINIEYIRNPDDTDFSRYFAKMVDALGRVATPYVMLADNDDFLVFTGMERSLDFLDGNPDYVCCGGGIGGFAVYSPTRNPLCAGLRGALNRLSYRYMPYDRSIDLKSTSVTERLLLGMKNSWSYYAVFRTSALVTIWHEIAEMNLSDLQLTEKYCAMRALTLGKARSDAATIAYLRQYWTSMRSAFAKDWVHHLLRSRFSSDFSNVVGRISDTAAFADGADVNEVRDKIQDEFALWFGEFLRRNYGSFAILRGYLRRNAPGILAWLKTRRRFSVARERRAVLAKLKSKGASAEYQKTFRGELAQIEAVIAGDEFNEFIKSFSSKFEAKSSHAEIARAGRQ
jgi:glycosyltransferase domain-containing protein